MIIYLDESGDLGFDFNKKKTSHYLVLCILVCDDSQVNLAIVRAVKRTLENKLSKNLNELKGNHTLFSIKNYFLKKLKPYNNWRLYVAVANKKTWLQHHKATHNNELEKKILYDEVASRLFSQVDIPNTTSHVQIVVDRSKNQNDIGYFDARITSALAEKISTTTRLSIRHRPSYEDPGLQAVDLFCWGISRKYEKSDIEWYAEFADRIAVEVEYKF